MSKLVEQKTESIKYKIKYTIYEDVNSGFKIFNGVAYSADNGERLCKCRLRGSMQDVATGDEVFASGYWDDHPKYGLGFVMNAYVKIMPTDENSMFEYLSQGNIAGISKKRAELIVKEFGKDTFDVLVYRTEELKNIRGIGEKSIEKIKISAKSLLQEQQMLTSVMSYIQGFGISPAYAQRIYNRYKLQSLEVIKNNPYKLADEVKGIGFLKADEIAVYNGMPLDSPERIQSAILFTLKKMNEDGHVFGYKDEITKKCKELLNLDLGYIENGISELVLNNRVICEDTAIYSSKLYNAEKYSARSLVYLMNNNKKNNFNITKEEVKRYGKLMKIEYADEQIDAIVTACKSKVMILTGGPGTGKSTTINGIIHMLKMHGMKVLCAAPTGKASKRMREITGEEAVTIHRLLEVKSDDTFGFVFKRNRENPLEGDVLIMDECSMIDMQLTNYVLNAIPSHMKVIFVGDVNQLPSVGCGNVLKEMIASGILPTVTLTKIFRQAQQSDIVKNAHMINDGIIPSFKNHRDGDYFFMDTEKYSQEEIRDKIVEYVGYNLPNYYHVKPEDIQVLAPMKKGSTGVYELNNFLQYRINPPTCDKRTIAYQDHMFREGDKVMYTCNDYDKKVFNGDVGIVSYISGDDDIEDEEKDGKYFVVDFDGNLIQFKVHEAADFVLAYAMTIHKSQGSEFDIVVMPLTTSNAVMLQRNLLYTGVTRAKKVFVLFGQKKAVAMAVKTLKITHRNTKLKERLVFEQSFV